MDSKSIAHEKGPERTKLAPKKDVSASPSIKPLTEGFAVPLPTDLEDNDLPTSENKIDRKQKELKEQCHGEQGKEAEEHTLYNQYEEKIRPCIDLIDSLRSLGIEKDLSLPAIAVIGDQSSGKSSVLEALSGVALPRGNGIVTRCPLELKLKRGAACQAWKGKISYHNISKELQNASEVDGAIRAAQDIVAGPGGAISGEMISLEICSPHVPDLTLIDLPGIARVPVGNQPKDIGLQIKTLLKKTIGCKETLNLVVVPCNVDIATIEALKMAQEVDPSGERTLGILTKPDLVDKGTEESVIKIMQNLLIPLKKGYMMVKCRGQQDIYDELDLASAIEKERMFFKSHKHFSFLLEEGRATIPCLAERLTNELVRHIIKTLPTLESQLRETLQKMLQDLQRYNRGAPPTDSEKHYFLTDLIKFFNQDISRMVLGEEQVFGNETRLFSKIRKEFQTWEVILQECAARAKEATPSKMWKYEDQYRGRELTSFSNYQTFEDIVKEQIIELVQPALEILNKVIGLIEEKFTELTKKHFANFPNLNRAVKITIEDIIRKQTAETERQIRTQFKMERIVYCQDGLYLQDLNLLRAEKADKVGIGKEFQLVLNLRQEPSLVNDMVCHTTAYFNEASRRLLNQIPLIILSFGLHDFGDRLQVAMLHLLQEKDKRLYVRLCFSTKRENKTTRVISFKRFILLNKSDLVWLFDPL
ncbi:interferon-induced GTP-binding protein Mx-like [Pogoniulus pusillus]|uniref:interferon-induced GTP-binding protein Mx-like n=1 Tax=Pogoniulus pusillus TaxID=488313 RepID=UPI0030B94733